MAGKERQSSGAGSGMAGMALAIPIPNMDGRRHTNNVKKIENFAHLASDQRPVYQSTSPFFFFRMQTVFVFIEQVLKTRIFCNHFQPNGPWLLVCLLNSFIYCYRLTVGLPFLLSHFISVVDYLSAD
jgi:hypothetical protein